ncbi:MAG: ECF-type sigma factor [Luteolibacter sp.]
MSELERILGNVSRDGEALSAELLPLVYDELRDLAARRLSGAGGATFQATELVHEAWVRLGGNDDKSWNDRAHFFRAAAQAMRRILVDRARTKSALKRGAGKACLSLDEIEVLEVPQDERVLLVDEALEHLELENPECARLVILKFFGGLTDVEIAASEGVGERTIRRRWEFAKVRLFHLIQEGHTGGE